MFSLKHAGGELTTQEVQYRRGLFQGDALSPLLFCLSVTPLSFGLQNTTGYPAKFLTNPATHLMFVDDLKIYASGAKALGQSLKVVENHHRHRHENRCTEMCNSMLKEGKENRGI